MDRTLTKVNDALKRLISQLKPQENALSFLLVTGKSSHGRTTLLRQSQFEQFTINSQPNIDVYCNSQGIILDLGENWIHQSNHVSQNTLKQLNRCHKSLSISGIVLCIDTSELLNMGTEMLSQYLKTQSQLLDQFAHTLGTRLDTTIILTKLDKIAGFIDFFQQEHDSDLLKPLGFCFEEQLESQQVLANYDDKFNQLIEQLSQQVIKKIHPVRSSIKRTLIREFPLQLASLGPLLRPLIKELSFSLCHLQAIYFTSAEQGGLSIDRLNKKIQNEYSLLVQDQFPQSTNFRAYFIQGAWADIQARTKRYTPQLKSSYRWLITASLSSAFISLLWIGQQHIQATKYLNLVKTELNHYELSDSQDTDKTNALYHLLNASNTAEQITAHQLSSSKLQQLKGKLNTQKEQQIKNKYLPSLLHDIETSLADNQLSLAERYTALKIYLMFANPKHRSEPEISAWFEAYWKKHDSSQNAQQSLNLLKKILHNPMPTVAIKQQLVRDVRNFLNALPANYLYYALAKQQFPAGKQALSFQGFTIPSSTLPNYLTKPGFKQITTNLPVIAKTLNHENWVLARQDLNDLEVLLQEAYCHEYVVWWQQFIQQASPAQSFDLEQAQNLSQRINQADSIRKISKLIQENTRPEQTKEYNNEIFNREIARHFTEVNLISESSVHDVSQTIVELERWLSTFSMLSDQGKTAFALTKSRFLGESLDNPLSNLDRYAHRLPEPVASWTKKMSNDLWLLLIHDSRDFINRQWQHTVYQDYQNSIANRYPFDANATQEVALADFNRFFSRTGVLNQFETDYIKPFLDTSQPQWQLKESNNLVLPISNDLITQLIRANIISTMFFNSDNIAVSQIDFSLEKLNLDPIVSKLTLSMGDTTLSDSQDTNSLTYFHWPQSNARLVLNSIEGEHFELNELGPWAFFKILQKVNVLEDTEDNHNLQILFEINGNSGRYLLKADNQINPFTPGVLNGFALSETIA